MKTRFVLLVLLAISACGFSSSFYYYLAGIWGPDYPGGQLDYCRFLAIAPNGNVYVTDSGYNKVVYFDPAGSYLGQWGSTGNGAGCFMNPLGIDIDLSGNVYVADANNHRVQKFTADGSYILEWGIITGGQVSVIPIGLAVAPTGNVYVVGRDCLKILEYTPTGELIREWGPTFGGIKFVSPYDIAIAQNGNIYVTDNPNILLFTADGEYLNHYYLGLDGTERAICISSNDVFYLFDWFSHSIKYYSLDAVYLGSIPANEGFFMNSGIDTLDGARVYGGARKISYFDSNVVVEPQSLGRIKGFYH